MDDLGPHPVPYLPVTFKWIAEVFLTSAVHLKVSTRSCNLQISNDSSFKNIQRSFIQYYVMTFRGLFSISFLTFQRARNKPNV